MTPLVEDDKTYIPYEVVHREEAVCRGPRGCEMYAHSSSQDAASASHCVQRNIHVV